MNYQCVCSTAAEIHERMDQLRVELIHTGIKEGLLSSNTIRISQQLDACLNKYEVVKKSC
ncbi:aspartyl-phosphate phosphatase Spo0E family protein [Peribacillus deserti]|uniref:Aspartyl-phosphate phosphatase Spo0E family protein n=1 Tax=Peribacillus deserti TaxID=673318 RepID=A0A2N5M0L5_9BACI|nr:aspartyl-phosphate phosphatase Spo0E family protein [Peribacillus deserti]PLT27902.1 hypothetical protein CUU66_21455 [Peribacillus deserti]